MKVSQKPEILHNILRESHFTVPRYQRAYSWGLDEISDLYYDILGSNEAGHFLGSILLFENSKKNNLISKEIIDGQQRLTSIFLLLFSLLKELKSSDKPEKYENSAAELIEGLIFVKNELDFFSEDSNEPRLELSKADRQIFKKIINDENFNIDKFKQSQKNLDTALLFFSNKIKDLKKRSGSQAIVDLVKKLLSCKFIIITAEEEADKLLLFKTLNARGLDLTQSDIIKNEICTHLNEDTIEESIDKWDEIRGIIEKKSGNFNNFLFHYINSLEISQSLRHEKDKKIGVISSENKNYFPPVPEKMIFEIYSLLINKTGAQKFLEEIEEAAKTYVKFIDPNSVNSYSNNLKKYFVSLKTMNVTKCFPLLLSASHIYEIKDFEKICKAIEALTFRHSVLRKDPKELEVFYYELIIKMYKLKDISIILQYIGAHENFKEEEKFKSEFITTSFRESMSKVILDRIISNMAEGVDLKTIHLEHIMPKQHKDNWSVFFEEDKDKYKNYLNRLGNLTLIKSKLNVAMKNHDFSIKKDYYEQSSIKITTDLLGYEGWGYSEIEKRQKQLYELAKDIWVI